MEQSFVEDFSARIPMPLTWPRVLLQVCLLQRQLDEAKSSLFNEWQDMMLADHPAMDPVNWTIDVVDSAAQPNRDPRPIWADVIDDFSARVIHISHDVLVNFCQNRTRLRRLSGKAVIQLDQLESVAKEYDANHLMPESGTDDSPSPLLNWTRFEKLRLMELVVELGLEQDVYLPDELYGMYAYLKQLMIERLHRQLYFMRQCVRNRGRQAPRAQRYMEDGIGKFLRLQLWLVNSVHWVSSHC